MSTPLTIISLRLFGWAGGEYTELRSEWQLVITAL